MTRFLLAVIGSLLAPCLASADTLTLKDGRTVTGRVTGETVTEVTVEIPAAPGRLKSVT